MNVAPFQPTIKSLRRCASTAQSRGLALFCAGQFELVELAAQLGHFGGLCLERGDRHRLVAVHVDTLAALEHRRARRNVVDDEPEVLAIRLALRLVAVGREAEA